jgi:peptidoglycan/xylan/chitin deacetylase (PgdA/CDA1 family)
MKKLNIIMYHYVRESKKSKFPNINSLELKEFINQLNFLKKKYKILSYQEFIYYSQQKKTPKNSCMLTFDDGYKDHIKYVLPELNKRDISGFFFPSAKVIMEKSILDINLLHIIQSKISSEQDLIKDLDYLLIKNNFSEKKIRYFKNNYLYQGRYDSKYIRYFKEVIQNMNDIFAKNKILDVLLKKYVNIEKEELSKSLYLSHQDILELIKNKMYIGGHGYDHLRLGKLSYEKQKKEISKTINFLKFIKAPTKKWLMCYPYGSYNAKTINLLKKKNCLAGLTVKVGSNNLDKDNLFELNRYDTNDFTK